MLHLTLKTCLIKIIVNVDKIGISDRTHVHSAQSNWNVFCLCWDSGVGGCGFTIKSLLETKLNKNPFPVVVVTCSPGSVYFII